MLLWEHPAHKTGGLGDAMCKSSVFIFNSTNGFGISSAFVNPSITNPKFNSAFRWKYFLPTAITYQFQ